MRLRKKYKGCFDTVIVAAAITSVGAILAALISVSPALIAHQASIQTEAQIALERAQTATREAEVALERAQTATREAELTEAPTATETPAARTPTSTATETPVRPSETPTATERPITPTSTITPTPTILSRPTPWKTAESPASIVINYPEAHSEYRLNQLILIDGRVEDPIGIGQLELRVDNVAERILVWAEGSGPTAGNFIFDYSAHRSGNITIEVLLIRNGAIRESSSLEVRVLESQQQIIATVIPLMPGIESTLSAPGCHGFVNVSVNLRQGPDVMHDPIQVLYDGAVVPILGISPDRRWLFVEAENRDIGRVTGWIHAGYVSRYGLCQNLPQRSS